MATCNCFQLRYILIDYCTPKKQIVYTVTNDIPHARAWCTPASKKYWVRKLKRETTNEHEVQVHNRPLLPSVNTSDGRKCWPAAGNTAVKYYWSRAIWDSKCTNTRHTGRTGRAGRVAAGPLQFLFITDYLNSGTQSDNPLGPSYVRKEDAYSHQIRYIVKWLNI